MIIPPTEPVHMTGNGKSPTREAINLNGGRKTRYNTRETRSMNITETKLKIGNWNGQGLSSPVNINIPIDECEQFQLDIIALTELHWPGRGRTKHKNLEFIHSGSDNCRREMVARFNCRHTKLTTPYTVICYAPTNSETCPDDVTNRNAFYDQVDDLLSSIPKHDIQIVFGDMNAQVGNDTSTWKPVLGRHAEGALNDNGIRLQTLCLAPSFVVDSLLFPHKKIHKLTWNSQMAKQ